MARGTALDERIGDRVSLLRFALRGFVTAFMPTSITTSISTSSAYTQEMSLAVVLDHKSGAATSSPTYADIFDSTDSHAFQRLDSRDRFTLLYHKVYSFVCGMAISPGTTSNGMHPVMTANCMQSVDLDIPVNRTAVFKRGASGAAYTDVQDGQIFVIMTANPIVGLPTGSNPSFSGNARLTYVDV